MEKTAIFKAIFLVLAILFFLGFISLQVFAAEEDMQYQDTSSLAGGTNGENLPSGGAPTSEPDFSGNDMQPEDWGSFLSDVSAIRRNSDLFLCFVIPCFCAVLAVYKFCMWFYSTFIESAL